MEHLKKIELKDKEEIIIDNGYFLACNKKMDYTIEKLGKTMASTFLGGEGYGMKFIGPELFILKVKIYLILWE